MGNIVNTTLNCGSEVGVFSLHSIGAGINSHRCQIKLIISDPDTSVIHDIFGAIFNLSMSEIFGIY
jgi:hypothetical protein